MIRLHSLSIAAAALLSASAPHALAQTQPNVTLAMVSNNWSSRVCVVCACPTVINRVWGHATLVYSHSDQWDAYYTVTGIGWYSDSGQTVTGTGTYRIGGDFALTHHMSLDVLVNGVPMHFESTDELVTTPFPDIRITVDEPHDPNPCYFNRFYLNFDGRCSLADIATVGGEAQSDGQLTVDDLVLYLDQFFNTPPFSGVKPADICGLGGALAPDGEVTADDLIAYLSAFFAGGC